MYKPSILLHVNPFARVIFSCQVVWRVKQTGRTGCHYWWLISACWQVVCATFQPMKRLVWHISHPFCFMSTLLRVQFSRVKWCEESSKQAGQAAMTGEWWLISVYVDRSYVPHSNPWKGLQRNSIFSFLRKKSIMFLISNLLCLFLIRPNCVK